MLCVLLFVFLLISCLSSQMIISCVFVFVMFSFLFFGFGLPWGWRRKSRNGRACLVMVSAYPCAYPNASVGPLGRPSGLSPPAHSPRRTPQALSKALIGVQGGLVQAHRPGCHGASLLERPRVAHTPAHRLQMDRQFGAHTPAHTCGS